MGKRRRRRGEEASTVRGRGGGGNAWVGVGRSGVARVGAAARVAVSRASSLSLRRAVDDLPSSQALTIYASSGTRIQLH